MAFLALPTGQLLWQNLPWNLIQQAIDHNPDVDIAGVDGWQPSQSFQMNPTVLRLAFRHGVACSRGIVFDDWLFNLADGPQRLQRSQADVGASRAALPKWAQHPELDAATDKSTQDSISRARSELDKNLAVPAKSELVQHWRDLGGFLPDPL